MMISPYWHSTSPSNPAYAPLSESIDADVVIVGGGFTGLWTAYYLKQQRPEMRVVVLEKDVLASGASGRNGGWFMGRFAGLEKYLEKESERRRQEILATARSPLVELQQLVDAGLVDCDMAMGGTLEVAARYSQQLVNLEAYHRKLISLGHSEYDYQWLNAAQAERRVSMTNIQAAMYTPHCAAINPWKLAQDLIKLAANAGVEFYEHSAVVDYSDHKVATANASVSAKWVVLAQEGLRSANSPSARYVLPVQSMMIITEPLAANIWERLGLHNRESYSDASTLSTYGQRTRDDRLIFGARGHYLFGGKARHNFAASKPEFARLEALMKQCFEPLAEATVSHAWGGTLGISRKQQAQIAVDEVSGRILAGGYGGEGVGASNLFGRTIAKIITGEDTVETSMPWVKRGKFAQGFARWEPEPLRWLVYSSYRVLNDREDALRQAGERGMSAQTVSKLASLVRKLVE